MSAAWLITTEVLEEARAFFEERGSLGLEGTALISDGPDGPRLVIPDQVARRIGRGVSVETTRAGLVHLAASLGADDRYLARIHSHPDEAFHSPADNANPVLTHIGALSIVVPYYGLGLRHGLDACAVLRRDDRGWQPLQAGLERRRWLDVESLDVESEDA
jgi:hypothetical protein